MSDKINVQFKINLTKGQREAYDLLNDKDINTLVLCYSRQSGKTVLAEIALIKYLILSKRNSAYISPSFKLGQKVYKEIIQLLQPTGLITKANASSLSIETKTGSSLQFFSAESPTAIRGQTFSGIVVIDEFAFFPDELPSGEDIYANVILPTTKVRKPKILIISTPRGKRGRFFELYSRALRGDKGMACLKKTIYDDNLVSQEQIDELRKSMPKLAWEQEFEVKFLDNALTVFQGFEYCFKNIPRYSYSKTWIGIDPSGNGEDFTILTKINEKNEVEQFEINGTLDQKYKKIADMINDSKNLQGVLIENNGIGAVFANEVKKLVKNKMKVFEWNTTNKSKEEIISNLIMEIANKEIYFNKDDKKLFSELSTFTCSYTKNGNMTFSAMGTAHDDRIMSLAIALECRKSRKPISRDSFSFINNPYKSYI